MGISNMTDEDYKNIILTSIEKATEETPILSEGIKKWFLNKIEEK